MKKKKQSAFMQEFITEFEKLPKEEREDFLIEGDRIIIGGMTVHARLVPVGKRKRAEFWYGPPVEGVKIPDYVKEFDEVLHMVCEGTVAVISERAWTRFSDLMISDGAKDRLLYRIIVTLPIDEQEDRLLRVTDHIDPGFLRADPFVACRAKKARAILARMTDEGRQFP
jgi:hypothetical protein